MCLCDCDTLVLFWFLCAGKQPMKASATENCMSTKTMRAVHTARGCHPSSPVRIREMARCRESSVQATAMAPSVEERLYCDETIDSERTPKRARKFKTGFFELASAKACLFCRSSMMRTAIERVRATENAQLESSDIRTFVASALCAQAELLQRPCCFVAGEYKDHLSLGFPESSWQEEHCFPMASIDLLFSDPDGVLSFCVQLAASGGMKRPLEIKSYGGSQALESRIRLLSLLLVSQKMKTEQVFSSERRLLPAVADVAAMLCGRRGVSGRLVETCVSRLEWEQRRALDLPLLAAELQNPVDRAEFLLWDRCAKPLLHIAIGTLFPTYCAILMSETNPSSSLLAECLTERSSADFFARVLAGLSACSAQLTVHPTRRCDWLFCEASKLSAKNLILSVREGCAPLTSTGALVLEALR
jgi:hypothetical protein